jgi:hypothetical protein
MTKNSKYNTDLATRQMEINEWGYHNKLETLFIFQLIFLVLTFFAVLMYVHKSGHINMYFMGLIMIIVLFLLAVVISNRVSYTVKVRDKRFWNRRQFGYMDALDPSKGSAEFLTSLNSQTGNLPAPGPLCPTACPATSK